MVSGRIFASFLAASLGCLSWLLPSILQAEAVFEPSRNSVVLRSRTSPGFAFVTMIREGSVRGLGIAYRSSGSTVNFKPTQGQSLAFLAVRDGMIRELHVPGRPPLAVVPNSAFTLKVGETTFYVSNERPSYVVASFDDSLVGFLDATQIFSISGSSRASAYLIPNVARGSDDDAIRIEGNSLSVGNVAYGAEEIGIIREKPASRCLFSETAVLPAEDLAALRQGKPVSERTQELLNVLRSGGSFNFLEGLNVLNVSSAGIVAQRVNSGAPHFVLIQEDRPLPDGTQVCAEKTVSL